MRFLLLQSESGYQCHLHHFFPQQKTSSSYLMLLRFVHNLIYWTYSGVSRLLEFLCNGLVRRHDDKHLDAHVEDAHWNQVGHVVSMDRDTHSRLKKSENSIYLSCKHCAEIMFVYGTCLPCLGPVCSKSWGARSRTLPSQWGAWQTRRQWTATQTQPEWWHCSTAALSLGRTIFFMTSLNTSNTMNAYSSRLLILFLF